MSADETTGPIGEPWDFAATLAARITHLGDLMPDPYALCNFLGRMEREVLVWQTIRAAIINLEQHGEPFSYRGDGVFTVSGGGLADNASAYLYLVAEKHFFEDERDGRVVIFPTEKLVDALEAFFADPDRHQR